MWIQSSDIVAIPTGIFWIDIAVPWNYRVNKRTGGLLVEEDRQVDGNFGSTAGSDIGRQSAEMIHQSLGDMLPMQ